MGLVREPLNPFDPNAIKVLNTRGVQVGHIERAVARVLAPLVDEGLVNVEGIVPNGKAGRFKLPVQVHVFAGPHGFESVREAISRGGLQLISNDDASFTLSEAAVVKQKKAKGERSLDEIFKLVDENVNKKTVVKALDPPKDIIKSELFAHQKEGLGWLVHRENSGELPPFWEEKNGDYVNVLTNYQTDTRPEPLRGGIFADDMGLGKTLTLLSLIAFDKCGGLDTKANEENDFIDDRLVLSSSQKAKRGRKSKSVTKRRKIEGSYSNACGRKVSLIVCPPSVFSSWVTQLSEHTKPGKLKVYMYYGERTGDVDELRKYDMVLTTYSTLASEENWAESPVKEMEWWRVVLDEAHVIKNANAQQSCAVTNLKAKRRWVVTGTPIQNSSLDLFSLMAFLRFEPFSIKSYWRSLVQRALAQGDSKGLMRLQVLMATISLRRTKDKALIGLPPKTVETCVVELSCEERELYDRLESQAKSVVRNYIQAGSLTNNYSTVLSIILRLRQICTDVALCPSDLQALFASNNLEDVSNNPELLKKMVSQLQDGEDLDCPICISPPTDIVITICAHIFCQSCILKTLKKTKPLCPLCRHPLSESDLFSSPPESSDPENLKFSSSSSSAKVSALIKLLISQRNQNPDIKSVVFSQFQKCCFCLKSP